MSVPASQRPQSKAEFVIRARELQSQESDGHKEFPPASGLSQKRNLSSAQENFNPKKVMVTKITKGFNFLKCRYFVTKTGKIVRKPCRKAVTRQRAQENFNPKKVMVTKITKGFNFLKCRYFVTKTGKIVRKPCRKAVTRQRRRIKKLFKKVEEGKLSLNDVQQSYLSHRAYRDASEKTNHFNGWMTACEKTVRA